MADPMIEAVGRLILDGPGEWIGSGAQLHDLATSVAARVRAEALPTGPDEELIAATLAAVSWEHIGEPGDRMAMAGPREAAEHVARTVAAAVRAEAVAERAEIVAVIERYLPEALPFNALPEIVGGIARQRDFQHELKDHLADVARRLTDEHDRAVAEAVAEERRRVEAALDASDLFAADAPHNPAAWELRAALLAAGSVPVATPATCGHGCERVHPVHRNGWHMETCPGPVVTPTAPAERHVCSEKPCCVEHHAWYGQLCTVPGCDEDWCIGAKQEPPASPVPDEQPPWCEQHPAFMAADCRFCRPAEQPEER